MNIGLDKSLTAANFIVALHASERQNIAAAMAKSTVERTARAQYAAKLDELNVARLLFLTSNLSEYDYLTKAKALETSIEQLKSIIWPKE